MRALIISDSHGIRSSIKRVLERVGNVDMLIHLGDVYEDDNFIRESVQGEVYIIAGNNDFHPRFKKEEIIEIGPYRAWLTHGHQYGVNYGLERLEEEARTLGMDIVMFGHTHVPVIRQENELYVINPGSLAFPRQENLKGSFIIMELDAEEKLHFSLDYLD